jgi:hypothetical protein
MRGDEGESWRGARGVVMLVLRAGGVCWGGRATHMDFLCRTRSNATPTGRIYGKCLRTDVERLRGSQLIHLRPVRSWADKSSVKIICICR